MRKFIPMTVALALALVLGACSSSDDAGTTKKELGAVVEDVKDSASGALATARTEFVQVIEKKITDITSGLGDYGDRIEELNPAAAATAKKAMATVYEKVDVVQTRVNDLKNAPIESWADQKSGVETAVTDLQESYTKLTKLF